MLHGHLQPREKPGTAAGEISAKSYEFCPVPTDQVGVRGEVDGVIACLAVMAPELFGRRPAIVVKTAVYLKVRPYPHARSSSGDRIW
jgi:hypothetical protein